jgi:hypothetical protein
VSPESLAVLHESSQYGPESFSVGYAGGFNVLPAHGFPCEDGRAACGFTHLVHDGSSPSYRSYMAMTPELGLGIVTLANANNVADESLVPQINRNISYLLYGESPRDIVVFSDPLIRWGKHLIALVVVAQLILAGLTARRIKRSQPGYNRGRWALFGLATTVDLIALATIFVVIPVAAESPLGVTFSLPDYRLLIIAMGVGIAWGVVRSYLIVRHLSRTPR